MTHATLYTMWSAVYLTDYMNYDVSSRWRGGPAELAKTTCLGRVIPRMLRLFKMEGRSRQAGEDNYDGCVLHLLLRPRRHLRLNLLVALHCVLDDTCA
jgi:hypothetical protein